MSSVLERRWVALLDSGAWRRVGKSATGRRVLRSRSVRAADDWRRYMHSSLLHRRHPAAFASVRTCCLFLGTVKSGGTLVGSLLDAHPDVVLSDEADPLRYALAGFSRDQIFHLLVRTARRESMKGRVTARRLTPYSLAVPGQFQGRSSRPRVVGDSRAGPTTRRLGEAPELLDDWTALLGEVEPRYIHVVRNPYDPISAMVLRRRRSLSDAIADYTDQSRRVQSLRNRIPPERLLTVRYEDFVRAPAEGLNSICTFLGVEAGDAYLSACAGIVDPSRPGERHAVRWSTAEREAVAGIVRRFSFLEAYVGEDDR